MPPTGDPELVTAPGSDAAAPAGSDAEAGPTAPHLTTFSLEGRAVPGVYLVGWVASLMGAGLLFISFQANVPGTGQWVFLVAMLLLGVGLTFAAGSQAIERSRRPDLAYRGPSPVLTFLVVVVLTFVALIVVLAPLSAMGLDARSPAATTLNLLITMVLYVAVIRLLVVGPGCPVVARDGCDSSRRGRASRPAAGGAAGDPRGGGHARPRRAAEPVPRAGAQRPSGRDGCGRSGREPGHGGNPGADRRGALLPRVHDDGLGTDLGPDGRRSSGAPCSSRLPTSSRCSMPPSRRAPSARCSRSWRCCRSAWRWAGCS